MNHRRRIGIALVLSGALLLVLAASPWILAGSAAPRADYGRLAHEIHDYTWRHFAYAGGAADCTSAPYLTYRRDQINANIADHWYVALQVRADAAMVRLGEERFRCHVEKAYPWMEALWSPAHAGYAPRADLDTSNPTLVDVYADDNAVIGLAFLDIARTTSDPALRARALASADRAARYPVAAGLWDGDFGGGLWWTNQRNALGEGKPAQSTALLAHIMAEMYAETGDPAYRQHALDSLDWLDRTLWSEHHQLYAYSVVADPASPTGMAMTQRFFGYDQAIVMQALLALHRREPENAHYLARARQIGHAVDFYFWQQELGGYTLEADVPDLYASYGVWVSEAMLELYAVEGDQFWLQRARANFDALHERFRQGANMAYSFRVFPCRDEMAVLCQPGARWGTDATVYSLSQAMMQRVAALLAAA